MAFFEEGIREICQIIHDNGGMVLSGWRQHECTGRVVPAGVIMALMCATSISTKRLVIPHGGGGPGMGPICVNDHLAPVSAGAPCSPNWRRKCNRRSLSCNRYGSASILLISWAYIAHDGSRWISRRLRS